VLVKVLTDNEEVARRSVELFPGETRDAKIRMVLRGKGRKAIAVGIPKPGKRLTVTMRGKRKAKKDRLLKTVNTIML